MNMAVGVIDKAFDLSRDTTGYVKITAETLEWRYDVEVGDFVTNIKNIPMRNCVDSDRDNFFEISPGSKQQLTMLWDRLYCFEDTNDI